MNKFAIVASLTLVAACGTKTETANAPIADETAMPNEMAATAALEAPAPGDYDVTNPDGTKGATTLMAGGTYEDRDAAGKVTAKGTYTSKDGKTCFSPEGGAEECYTESARAADGSFTATDAKGAVTQVKPKAK